MHIVVSCATRRGFLFVQKLAELLPTVDFTVISFKEELGEPPFLDEIRKFTLEIMGQFFEARQLGGKKLQAFWESSNVDLMFCINWRYMIPARIYNQPRLGTFVFHDSLLPEYRGFSPTVWAMINGEDHTGVTLFEVATNVDEGNIVDQNLVSIGENETISSVMERVTQTYLEMLEKNLTSLIQGVAQRKSQDHSRATYTTKRLPEDNQIDWTMSSKDIYNLIRAVSRPYSGAYTTLLGKKLRVWSALRIDNGRRYVGGVIGRVAEIRHGEGVVVITGDGTLMLAEVQCEDDEPKCAADVINRHSYTLGR